MSSRAVVVVLLALAITPMANAGQTSTELLPHHTIALNAQALSPALTVSDLFVEVANRKVEIRANGTVVLTAPPPSVIMARVYSDGHIETACVHDEESVHAFLNADAEHKRAISAAPHEK